jgi:integrase
MDIMARPPLGLGTSGRVRSYRTPAGWRARTAYRDYDGITREIQRHASTKAKAERALAEAVRDRTRHDNGAEIRPDMRVAALAEAWFRDVSSGDRSPSTLVQYRYRLDRQIIPALGELRIRELTPGTIDRHLAAVTSQHGSAAARTVRSVLSGMAGLAARNDAIDRNPVRDAGRIKNGRKKAPTALNEAEARQLLALLTYDDRAISRDLVDLVAFMLATGARIGEACALRWAEVDFDRQLVSITGTVVRIPGRGLVISATKTTTSNRVLRIPGWIVEILHARRGLAAKDRRADETPVFPAPLGGLRDRSNTQAHLREAFERAGFGSITSHALRKTTATLLDTAGLSAREIADQLGHAKPSMTTDVYLGRQVASTRAADVLESLG